MSKGIVRVDYDFLSRIHNGESHTPNMYFHNNPMVRWLFWERLNVIANYINNNRSIKRGKCIDFGGGSGVFLPTLSLIFQEVILVDLDPSQAEIIIDKFELGNCKIVNGDVFEQSFDDADCIIAADVLEHFEFTTDIVSHLKTWMSSSTFLISSLPTENWFYLVLRKMFKQEKPIDHYHDASYVENCLTEAGFSCTKNSRTLPLPKPFDLFSIREWKLID
jgi:predicted TPR repeat methyltransferase